MRTYNSIRIAIAAAIAAAAVTITSCDEETLVAAPEQGMHTITLAAPGSNPETKITATPNTGNTLGIKMAWEVGDEVAFHGGSDKVVYSIASASDIKADGSATFTGSEAVPSYYDVYYPADGKDAIDKLPSDGESYSKTIEVKSDNSHIEVLMYGDYNTNEGYKLHHAYSYMRLEAELPSYAKNPTMRFSIDDYSSYIYTVKLPTGDSLYSVNIPILPASNPSKAKLETSEDGNTYKTVAEKDPDALYAGRQYRMIGDEDNEDNSSIIQFQDAAFEAALVNPKNFPDYWDEAYKAQFIIDTNDDGEISMNEAAAATHVYVDGEWDNPGTIKVMPELQYFTALTHLYCSYNSLTTLDVSKNTALTHLTCYGNLLTALNVSKNTALTNLDCSGNSLETLDVSKNTVLGWLECSRNSLTILDVSKNTALDNLDCNNNSLTTLNVNGATAIRSLSCFKNSLETLDVSNNRNLGILECDSNSLAAIDVSKNTELERLSCDGNSLATLDVSKNTALTSLECNGNSLTTLDVSKNTELTQLSCAYNHITALDVSSLTKLGAFGLWCGFQKDNKPITVTMTEEQKALPVASTSGNPFFTIVTK